MKKVNTNIKVNKEDKEVVMAVLVMVIIITILNKNTKVIMKMLHKI